MTVRRRALACLVPALVVAASACGGGSGAGSAGDDSDTGELTVLAAASLTDVFTELGERFEAEQDAEVTLSLGSSTDLAEQAGDGAPGDVLATADTTSMGLAEEAGVTREVSEFATNVLVVVTAPGNPLGIESLDDLEGTSWVRCADEVPCGRVAVEVLDAAGVTAEPASLEEDVRATLDKVTSGEVDAGLVYASDAVAAGDAVATVEVPEAAEVETTYAVATLEQSVDGDLARAWVDLLLSDEGRRVLEQAGFTMPDAPS
ncbi:molybdate ABC transporter substrate-binding protein [Nocardioides sediminis]|uniref:molybdate ABC transporter substrate-binding protein n=1 Tax=Nocardioides sediminis TaxID=433648 RepID=UPI000D2F6578|nr:molybdate ABC transporter substrate-binding protein [Nocardioides sediminis]